MWRIVSRTISVKCRRTARPSCLETVLFEWFEAARGSTGQAVPDQRGGIGSIVLIASATSDFVSRGRSPPGSTRTELRREHGEIDVATTATIPPESKVPVPTGALRVSGRRTTADIAALEAEPAVESDTPDDGAAGELESKRPRRYVLKTPKVISPSEPQSAWTNANKRVQFGYELNYLIDVKHAVIKDLVGFLSELHALKIDLFLHQQGLDTTTPARKAMSGMMGAFAEFEQSDGESGPIPDSCSAANHPIGSSRRLPVGLKDGTEVFGLGRATRNRHCFTLLFLSKRVRVLNGLQNRTPTHA
jgi:hypothetical protein